MDFPSYLGGLEPLEAVGGESGNVETWWEQEFMGWTQMPGQGAPGRGPGLRETGP